MQEVEQRMEQLPRGKPNNSLFQNYFFFISKGKKIGKNNLF